MTQNQKSIKTRMLNDGLHVEEVGGSLVLKDGKGREIGGGGGGEPIQYLKDATSVNGILTITKKDGSTVVQDITGKIDKLGDVPGATAGIKYRFPFNFLPPVQNANNVSAKFQTLILDDRTSGGDYTVEIPAADPSNDKAGVYTKELADAKSKVVGSTTRETDVDTLYSLEIDGVKHNLPGANYRLMTLGFDEVAGEPGKYEGILSAPGIYTTDEVMALFISGYGYVEASGRLSGGEKGEMWFLPTSNFENDPALTCMYSYAIKGGTRDIIRYKLTAEKIEVTPGTFQVKATIIEDPIGGGSGGMETVEVTLTPTSSTTLTASLTTAQFDKLAGGNARLKGTATLPNGTWTLLATDMEKQAYTVGTETKYNLYGQLITASDGQIAGIYIRERTGTETGDYTLIATLRNFMTEVKGGRFLGWWEAVQGKPSETYIEYEDYRVGDYYRIAWVAVDPGEVNHKPTGTRWEGQTSTVVETEAIALNNYYIYAGSGVWDYNVSPEFDLTFDKIAGSFADCPHLNSQMNALGEAINSLENEVEYVNKKGRLLGNWSCVTGKPMGDIIKATFDYNDDDYYIVEEVSGTHLQNLKPEGSQYTGAASTEYDTADPDLGSVYKYEAGGWANYRDNVPWQNFKNIGGEPADNPELEYRYGGAIKKITMNSSQITVTGGEANLGTVITAHQSLDGKQDKFDGTPTDGQLIRYNATAGKWQPFTLPANIILRPPATGTAIAAMTDMQHGWQLQCTETSGSFVKDQWYIYVVSGEPATGAWCAIGTSIDTSAFVAKASGVNGGIVVTSDSGDIQAATKASADLIEYKDTETYANNTIGAHVKSLEQGVDGTITITSSITEDTITGTCKRFGPWEVITLTGTTTSSGAHYVTINGLTESDPSLYSGTTTVKWYTGDLLLTSYPDITDESRTSIQFRASSNKTGASLTLIRLIM